MLREFLQRLRPDPRPALATVYLRADRLFVQASDRTSLRTAGFWVAAGPVACLTASDEPVLLGRAVVEALARSRVDVPVPSRDADLEAPLREAAGVRSRRALMAGRRACAVAREGGELRLDAYHDGGASGDGQVARSRPETKTLRLPVDASPEVIGRAVLEALARATMGPD